jgi:hypothetical protein
MSYNSDEHNFTFRFHSAEGERDLEMNCNALYVDDVLSFMRDFLQGCGYQIEGTIEVVPFEDIEEFENDAPLNYNEYDGYAPKQDKFSMDHLPNNGWPFGMGQSVQSLTTADIQPLTTAQIQPLTASQIESWSAVLPTQNGGKVRVGF